MLYSTMIPMNRDAMQHPGFLKRVKIDFIIIVCFDIHTRVCNKKLSGLFPFVKSALGTVRVVIHQTVKTKGERHEHGKRIP